MLREAYLKKKAEEDAKKKAVEEAEAAKRAEEEAAAKAAAEKRMAELKEKQTAGSLGPEEEEELKKLESEAAGAAAAESDPTFVSPAEGEGEGEPTPGCIAFVQTGGCDADGAIEFRKSCHHVVPKGASGYCECSGDVKIMSKVNCEHDPFACVDVCPILEGAEAEAALAEAAAAKAAAEVKEAAAKAAAEAATAEAAAADGAASEGGAEAGGAAAEGAGGTGGAGRAEEEEGVPPYEDEYDASMHDHTIPHDGEDDEDYADGKYGAGEEPDYGASDPNMDPTGDESDYTHHEYDHGTPCRHDFSFLHAPRGASCPFAPCARAPCLRRRCLRCRCPACSLAPYRRCSE